MKNLFKFIAAILLVTAFAFNSKAQSTLLGGGLSLFSNNGTEIGINAKGAIGFNESMEVSPSLNYYLTENITLIGINGDFHYLLGDEGSFRFYPLAGINFIVTILKMRCPGMTLMKMPIFTWTAFCTSIIVALAFPILTVTLFLLYFDRILGMHFFSPVHRMPLVEVIPNEKTSPQAISTVFALAKRLGKTPILVNLLPFT